MNIKTYPFHESLRNTLKAADSPLYAMRLIRSVAFGLDVSHDEVEILIGMASHIKPLTLAAVHALVPHISKVRFKRLMKNLEKIKVVRVTLSDDGETLAYDVDPRILTMMKAVTKDQLK